MSSMMRQGCIRLLILAFMVITPGAASATPFQFVWTGTIQSVTGTLPGVSVGDTATLTVIADNGGSSTVSQEWFVDDVVSANLAVGTYVASYTPPGNCDGSVPNRCFATDANGDLISAFYEDGVSPFLGTDSFGTDGVLALANTGFRPTTGCCFAGWGNQEVASWGIVPEPSSAALFALGLVGLTTKRRRIAN
jgi:hypothetical protein